MTPPRPAVPEPETPHVEVDLHCSLAAQAAPSWERFTPEARPARLPRSPTHSTPTPTTSCT